MIQHASRLLGQSVELADVFRSTDEPDPEPLVARCRLEDGTTVVVKSPRRWKPYLPDEPGGPADPILTEWAALECFAQRGVEVVPRLIAADRDSGVLVMSDAGTGPRMSDLLLGEDADAATAAMVAFGRSLGHMHRATADVSAEEWTARRSVLGPPSEPPESWYGNRLEEFVTACGDWGVDATDARAEVAQVLELWREHGLPTALTHGDPCPDNLILSNGEVLILDFEAAAVRPAVQDASYARVPFPTCWCIGRIPEDVIGRMEEAYVAASDYRVGNWHRDVAFACAYWFVLTTPFQLTRLQDEDRRWGTYGSRARLPLRARALASAAREISGLERLSEIAAELAHLADDRWRDDTSMDVYPAFRSATPEGQP